jgi:DNA-binding NarL/FixJ family response regulator
VLCPDKECGGIDKALKAGIAGFLSWKKDLDKLVPAVRSVFYGGLYISELAKNQLLVKLGHINTTNSFCRNLLTMTEYNIFNGIILGHTDKEIAEDLNMTLGALRNCINKAKKKTGLCNRTQITVYALLSGILNFTQVREKILSSLG